MWQFSFLDIFYKFRGTKFDKAILLQSWPGCLYKVRQVLPSGIEVYYKEQQTLQNSPGITKCESYYQVRRNTGDHGKN